MKKKNLDYQRSKKNEKSKLKKSCFQKKEIDELKREML